MERSVSQVQLKLCNKNANQSTHLPAVHFAACIRTLLERGAVVDRRQGSLSRQGVDVVLHVAGQEVRLVPAQRCSVPVDEELLEVPPDVAAVLGRVEQVVLGPKRGHR